MTYDEIVSAIENLSDDEYKRLTFHVSFTERLRRENAQVVAKAEAGVIADLREAGTIEAPKAADTNAAADEVPDWVSPGTDLSKMYTKGARVKWNGRFWESTTDALNHWEPGGTGVYDFIWRDVTNKVAPAPKPADATNGEPILHTPGLSVNTGDVIRYNGEKYRVLQPHRMQAFWPPNVSPSLYEKVS